MNEDLKTTLALLAFLTFYVAVFLFFIFVDH